MAFLTREIKRLLACAITLKVSKQEHCKNHDAKMLRNWLCSNGLILNPKQGKTEFMMFVTAAKRSKITHQTKITIDSKDISNTNSYKYLGMHLDTSLTLNDYIKKSVRKL